MISHKHKCIFVHIPKCGGQSVEHCFLKDHGIPNRNSRKCYDELNICPWPPNKFPKEMRNSHWLSSDYPKLDYFKFTIIRNPLHRAISFFKWYKKFDEISFEAFCTETLSTSNEWEYTMVRPQVDYLEGGVDKILKFGSHAPFFKKRFGFTLPHINKSKKRKVEVTELCEKIIKEKYKEDFKLWNQETL